MHSRAFVRVASSVLALCVLVPIGAPRAAAKEESKISIRLEGAGPVRGDVRTQLQGSKTRLQLRVRGAEPATEYMLLALDDESATEGAELGRFTTGRNGQFTGSFDVGKKDGVDAPVDPRGRFLAVSDGVEVILGGWLYGAAEDDAPMTKVKELTELQPDPTVNPTGHVEARYDLRPNGHGTFRVSMRGVPEGDYLLRVDGVEVAILTPNPGGNARATSTTRPSHGKPRSRPHNVKAQLDFDPRRKWVDLLQANQTYFSGPMIAQIHGVNSCMESASTTPFMLGPGQIDGAGSVTLSLGSDCETSLEVEVEDLAAGTYDLYVDGARVGMIEVADDGGGNLVGRLDFDPTPDQPGELPLDFAVGSGSEVEVFAAGESAPTSTPLLTATIP